MGVSRLFKVIANRSLESIEFVIALVWLVSALWILNPGFTPDLIPTVALTTQVVSTKIVAIWMLIISMPDMIALWLPNWSWRYTIRRFSTFSMFLSYLFFASTRIILFGAGSLIWILHIALALISAILYISMARGRE